MCTAYQLSEVHELRLIMEMVKMHYLLLKAAVNTGQPFVTLETWLKGRLNARKQRSRYWAPSSP